jgi:hypothetical protein
MMGGLPPSVGGVLGEDGGADKARGSGNSPPIASSLAAKITARRDPSNRASLLRPGIDDIARSASPRAAVAAYNATPREDGRG